MWTEEFLIMMKELHCEVKKDREESLENSRMFKLLQRIEL
jgi:hypothetical protein